MATESQPHLDVVRQSEKPTQLSAVGTAQPADTVMTLVRLATAYWAARCIQTVSELGVPDALDEQPRTASDLAQAVGANPDALDRVLRLLVSEGVFERRGDYYEHNGLSRVLRSDHPHSLRAYVRFVGTSLFWESYGAMDHVLRTGKTGVSTIEPRGVFQYFKDHPGISEIFDAAMRGKAESAIQPVLAIYDFSAFETIGDIGGGLGHLLKAILQKTPNTKGVLFDQPHVVSTAVPAERLELQGGDFFRGPLPKCDAYVLMEVLHDWTDAECVQILQQVRQAAPPTAKVLVIETVLPGDARPHFAHHLDIAMMVMTGGRERTPDQFARLFGQSGFRLIRVIPTSSPYSIVEAVVE